MIKHILILLLVLQFADPSRLFPSQTEIRKEATEKRIELYADYVYWHNAEYMNYRGFKGRITRKEARELVESAYRFSNFLFSPEDILAESQREAHFYPRAWNSYGATGAHQIVHRLWKWNKEYSSLIKSREDLFCPVKSTKAHMFVLSWFHVRTGDKEKTYARYSGGAGNYYSDIQKIKKDIRDIKGIKKSIKEIKKKLLKM